MTAAKEYELSVSLQLLQRVMPQIGHPLPRRRLSAFSRAKVY